MTDDAAKTVGSAISAATQKAADKLAEIDDTELGPYASPGSSKPFGKFPEREADTDSSGRAF